MEDEDYRIMVLNDTTMKVFRDGRIHTFHNKRKTWTNRKFAKDKYGYLKVDFGSHSLNNKVYYTVHQVIALCYLGENPNGYEVDHINNITTDNRLENLQYLTKIDNDRKRIFQKGQVIKGYKKRKNGKFEASIKHLGKSIYLGSYDTEEEARQAYVDAKLKYHGVVV
tara:strand:- start:42 stop:542 length:501 start_codon:yes stop_codon:yes gene_type:complete